MIERSCHKHDPSQSFFQPARHVSQPLPWSIGQTTLRACAWSPLGVCVAVETELGHDVAAPCHTTVEGPF